MRFADMHTHTTASDGICEPTDNVRMASEIGLDAIAITDHDTVAGINEALDAGVQYGILVIPGVEISTAVDGNEVHMLGYGVDYNNSLFLDRLRSLREVRNRRNELIFERLASLGMPITLEEVEAVKGKSERDDETIGRPHIAQVLVERGFVNNMQQAFDLYLAEGKAAYVSPLRITPVEAVSWIHDAGGIAVIAHPGIYHNDNVVKEILDQGADGIEAYHSDHDDKAEQRYKKMAIDAQKFITGGSDFHGVREGVAYHGPIGNRKVDITEIEKWLLKR
ncbi:MAG: PHP domain-containing protein [Candidatus Cohnella colombiensis]|uniref:PHP domain-containing protein n=1 Tax=Candidatus Cohnella colombiensis TaxID=3121368 RepID=A0AA95ETQ8_9BACL|nr:MAG: PHP domain-containing protein [Cohnella sp.]